MCGIEGVCKCVQVQVAEYTDQCVEYMGVINAQQRNADEQQRSVAARSKKTQEEEVQCKRLADAAMRDLASAMPALEEAVKVSHLSVKMKI